MLFDNGAHRRGMNFSRVIEVDPKANEIAWEYQGDPPLSFYSYNISSAERQPNGNTLICEGAPGRVFEVTPSGDMSGSMSVRSLWATPLRQVAAGSVTLSRVPCPPIAENHPAFKEKT
ncbi:MAG: hypothetical protein CM1200mP22_15540 [Dehalococcoidia bacterium]|nr:MAG: hypothetical protein CM1200mP22_15540 [Dehalococcoidia bacterium]